MKHKATFAVLMPQQLLKAHVCIYLEKYVYAEFEKIL